MRVGKIEREGSTWLVVYDERWDPARPPEDPRRYVFVPVAPVALAAYATFDEKIGSYALRSFDALFSGRDHPLLPVKDAPAEVSFAPFMHGSDVWITPNEPTRATFLVTDGTEEGDARLVVLFDTRFSYLGLSRDDRPPTAARVYRLSVLFGDP